MPNQTELDQLLASDQTISRSIEARARDAADQIIAEHPDIFCDVVSGGIQSATMLTTLAAMKHPQADRFQISKAIYLLAARKRLDGILATDIAPCGWSRSDEIDKFVEDVLEAGASMAFSCSLADRAQTVPTTGTPKLVEPEQAPVPHKLPEAIASWPSNPANP